MSTPKLVLVKVGVRNFKGDVVFQKTSREVEQERGATKGTSKVTVSVIPKDFRKALTTAESQIREYSMLYSIPWQDGGWRALPADKLKDFLAGLKPYEEAFEKAVQFVVANVDGINTANEARLGKLGSYKLNASELAGRYGVSVDYAEVTDPLRLAGMVEDDLKGDVEEQASAKLQEQVAGATRHLLDAVKHLASDIVRRTSKDAKNVKWKCLTDKIAKVTDAVEGLNIAGDAEIADGLALLKQIDLSDKKKAKQLAKAILGDTEDGKMEAETDEVFGTKDAPKDTEPPLGKDADGNDLTLKDEEPKADDGIDDGSWADELF